MTLQTKRLVLERRMSQDAKSLHLICSAPRLWTHFPSLRHSATQQTTDNAGAMAHLVGSRRTWGMDSKQSRRPPDHWVWRFLD